MKKTIEKRIADFVAEFQKRDNIRTAFGDPLVGIADAWSPEIQRLREIIGPDHVLPQDVLPDAKAIIVYYVPFTRDLAKNNRAAGIENGMDTGTASPQWARAYEELNLLFGELNPKLVEMIQLAGINEGSTAVSKFNAAVPAAAFQFDKIQLISNWSQRHIAYAAGLGNFGINNMLITRKGCCGRFSSVVTNIGSDILPPGKPMKEELCIYKASASDGKAGSKCGVCIRNCPGNAINPEQKDEFKSGFSRNKCYAVCLANAARYPVPEELLATSPGGAAPSYGSPGSEVCGKCITGSPCAFWKR